MLVHRQHHLMRFEFRMWPFTKPGVFAPRIASLALAAAILFVSQLAAGQDTGPSKYHIIRDLTYAVGVDGPLRGDAYVPNNALDSPGIVFIHGGGWTNGDRNQMVHLIRDLADLGYVGFTIDYDLVPAHFPRSLQESLAAVNYFRDHASEFHLDPKRIAVAGSSAGGELAALVALTPDAKVQAGVVLNGVLDLVSLGDMNSMVTNYLGSPCTLILKACRLASPVQQVHSGAPPFFVGHGTADQTVPFAQAEAFAKELRAAHVQCHMYVAADGPHTYWSKNAYYNENLVEIERFLATALKLTAVGISAPYGGL